MQDAVCWLRRPWDRRHAHLPNLVVLGLLALLAACESGGDQSGTGGSTGTGAGGSTSTGGAPGTGGSAASGGTTGTGGSGTTGSGGSPGSGGAIGPGGGAGGGGAVGTGGGGASGDCPARATFSFSDHTLLNVTWPAGLATASGTGVVHIWAKVTFTANGNTLSATAQACGSTLPPAMLTVLAGGGNVLVDIPNEAWDKPTMPRFMFQATQTGWNVGSTISYSTNALVGFTTDPGATWPTANTGIMGTVDADGDGSLGLTAAPRVGGGFVAPPTSILQTSRVDKVYLATRNSSSVVLTRTACDQFTGTVTFTHFDNHVMGCHVMGGQDCTAAEATFVDNNRTIYQVSSATNQIKVVPDNATCADVRAALPM
jgi:hypothetical protein